MLVVPAPFSESSFQVVPHSSRGGSAMSKVSEMV